MPHFTWWQKNQSMLAHWVIFLAVYLVVTVHETLPTWTWGVCWFIIGIAASQLQTAFRREGAMGIE